MKVFTYPLIPFTLSFIFGIICNRFFNFDYTQLAFPFLVICGIFFFFWYKTKNSWKPNFTFGFSTYLFAFGLGLFIQSFHFQPNSTKHYSHTIFKQENNVVIGIVEANLKPTAKNTKHIIRINSVNGEEYFGNLLVFISKEAEKNIIPGDEIIFNSDFIKIPKNFNPYQFDYAKYLENKNIFHEVFLKPNELFVGKHHNNWGSFWFTSQQKLTNSFNQHSFDKKTQAIINALLFGQRKLLDKETLTTYSNAGIIHILAISGLHVGILYLLLISLLKPLKRVKKGKFIELTVTLTFLWSFAILTGLSASVTRAVTMFSILAFGRFLNRDSSTYNTIAFSALLLLLFNPNFIFDVGFQMSYAAVLAIVSFNPFFKYFKFGKSKTVHFFTDIVLVSLAAQIGVLPLSLYYFNQFPALFLMANIVIIPLTIAILWLGITTLALNFIFPKLALLIGSALEICIKTMNTYAEWISSFDGFVFRNISFSLSLCVFAYIVIIAFILWCYQKNSKQFYYFLISLVCFQILYIGILFASKNESEFIFFNSKKGLISVKNNDKIQLFTDDVEINSENITDYKRGTFSDEVFISKLQNVYSYRNKNILVIDSLYFKIPEKPDIIFITNNATINLERVLQNNNPEIVIADNSNPFYKIEQWKATCRKRKIPFHATAEKGYYLLK